MRNTKPNFKRILKVQSHEISLKYNQSDSTPTNTKTMPTRPQKKLFIKEKESEVRNKTINDISCPTMNYLEGQMPRWKIFTLLTDIPRVSPSPQVDSQAEDAS